MVIQKERLSSSKGIHDANSSGSLIECSFPIGYWNCFGGNLVTWKSRRVVARSSVEAKYITMGHKLCESLWVTSVSRNGIPSYRISGIIL